MKKIFKKLFRSNKYHLNYFRGLNLASYISVSLTIKITVSFLSLKSIVYYYGEKYSILSQLSIYECSKIVIIIEANEMKLYKF